MGSESVTWGNVGAGTGITAVSAIRSNAASRARATFDDALIGRIAARHASGTWLKHACALEECSVEGLRDACVREPRWAVVIEKAHAEGAEAMRLRMLEAGTEEDDDGRTIRFGDWKREAHMLERWDPGTFHLVSKSESKVDGPPVQKLTIVVKSVDELRAVARGELVPTIIEDRKHGQDDEE